MFFKTNTTIYRLLSSNKKTHFMKNIYLLSFCILLINCSSIKNHNDHLNDLIAANDLKNDVDFTYKKLKKLHPKLYWYISKKDLDYKFDSLKSTITKPLTSYEFYKKITPVVAEIREGHIFVYPTEKKYSKKQISARAKLGVGPFSQFDFQIFDNKLFVIKNKSYDKTILVGSEIISINNRKTSELIVDYKKLFASDGYNTTFKNSILGTRFSNFYTYENGIKDSVKYNFKINNEEKIITIKRQIVDSSEIKKKKIVLSKTEKKAKKLKDKVSGYDKTIKAYVRNLDFLEKDSSIAVLKIKGFHIGNYSKFYQESFQKIKNNQSKTLIIDLRGNTGGRLNEIVNLYTYLSDSTFVFSDKSEVTQKTSLFRANYFQGGGIGTKVLKAIGSPFYYGYNFFSVHKSKDGKYYCNSYTKPQKIDKNAFKGKIYVLINGSSFSASSIISSNLKGSKRATFVGQETGGAYNGTVAGQMPIYELPNSKVKIKLGLIACIPHYKTQIEGRGIFPDKEIIPTLQDRINNNDPEMNCILEDIKK